MDNFTVEIYQDYGLDSEALVKSKDFDDIAKAKDWILMQSYSFHDRDENTGNYYYSHNLSDNWAIIYTK